MAVSSGIFTILLQAGLISHDEITRASKLMVNEDLPIIDALSKLKPDLTSIKIMQILSQFYGIPIFDINSYTLQSLPNEVIPVNMMVDYQVIPLAIRDNRLKLGVVDPTQKEQYEQIAFKSGLAVDLILVDSRSLLNLFNQNSTSYFQTICLDDESFGGMSFADDEQNEVQNGMVNSGDDDQPIVKFVHKVIYDAVQIGASDIHFEPYEKNYRVRYRIDGVLSEVASPPSGLKDKIAARIKVVSKLDISEKRVPQDGRLRLSMSQNQIIDFRVSTLPTAFGEKIVLRVLDRKSANIGIEALGFDDWQKNIIMDTIHRPYGMVLVTGPTGSGKTVTLYSCLGLLNGASRNISTAEDPIEIPISGINQVAINEKTGLTFGVALRAFLRQDPDIIMVGEIRDKDTAEMAIKAAQTGHLVLSTLHTNDAPSALTRLVSMGIPTYNVGDAILTIIAQRLVRKLCPHCKTLGKYDADVLLKAGFTNDDIDSGFQPYEPVGCERCHSTGYRGRIGIFEVMPISDALRTMILHNATSLELAAQARSEGILTLRQSGILKVRQGLTSIAEVEANTNN